MNKLAICKHTRKIAANALYKALKKSLKSKKTISEVDLRDAWIKELRLHKEIFPEGWYVPPLYGIGVLFATENELDRVSQISLRLKESWSRRDISLDTKKGIALLYASPVNKTDFIIGDFGLTIYLGENQSIQKHLKTVLKINHSIFNYAKTGMALNSLNNYAYKIMEKKGGFYRSANVNDKSTTDIGHSIPSTDEDWTKEELLIFKRKKSEWSAIKDIIATKRKFFNEAENFRKKPGFAFTIEPRPKVINNQELPTVFFHTIAIFHKNEKKELLTGFDKIFKLVGMDYMLD